MRILVACEESQAVTKELRKLGHDAFSCDIEPCSGGHPEWHLQQDVAPLLEEEWDMIIAFPPCTYLCSSGLHWNKRIPGRQSKSDDALSFVELIMDAKCAKIAIENPVGRIGSCIRKADQYVQPYEFGHDASKRTGLWLKGLPKLKGTIYIKPRMVCCGEVMALQGDKYVCPFCHGEYKPKPRWGNQTDSGQNKLAPSKGRAKIRSKTYKSIARAMAEQWTLTGA